MSFNIYKCLCLIIITMIIILNTYVNTQQKIVITNFENNFETKFKNKYYNIYEDIPIEYIKSYNDNDNDNDNNNYITIIESYNNTLRFHRI